MVLHVHIRHAHPPAVAIHVGGLDSLVGGAGLVCLKPVHLGSVVLVTTHHILLVLV